MSSEAKLYTYCKANVFIHYYHHRDYATAADLLHTVLQSPAFPKGPLMTELLTMLCTRIFDSVKAVEEETTAAECESTLASIKLLLQLQCDAIDTLKE